MLNKIVKFFISKKNIILGIVCVQVSLLSIRQISCLDIWLHIKTGQYIFETLRVPRHQLFSFFLGDKPWIDHEWLFQALVYSIHSLLGLNGLIFFRFIILLATIFLFFSIARKTRYFSCIAAICIIVSSAVFLSRLHLRPEIVSAFFIVIFLYFLKRYKKGRKIYLLALVQLLWANTHGYFILGPLLAFLYIVAKLIETKSKLPFSWNENKLEGRAILDLIRLLIILIFINLINPYFINGLTYPMSVLGDALSTESTLFSGLITELRPLTVQAIAFNSRYFGLHLCFILFFLSLFLNIRRIEIFDLFVFFIFASLVFYAKRHVGMLSVSLCALTLFNLKGGEESSSSIIRYLKDPNSLAYRLIYVISFCILIFLSGLFVRYYFNMIDHRYIYDLNGSSKGCILGKDEAKLDYPTGATDFIINNKVEGNIYNVFNQGAYLIYSLYPECKVFIDGRTELYGFKRLKNIEENFPRPDYIKEINKKFGIQCIILPCVSSGYAVEAFKYLYRVDNWRLVFFDAKSTIFLKNTEKNNFIIKNNRTVLEKFKISPKKDLIEQAKRGKFHPTAFINTASFFCSIGMFSQATDCIEIAEYILPSDFNIHNIKGAIFTKLGKNRLALKEFEKAKELDPCNPAVFNNIGILFLRSKQPKIAKEYFEQGLRINPQNEQLKRILFEIEKNAKEK